MPHPIVTKAKSSWIKGLTTQVAGPAVQNAADLLVRQHFLPNRGVMVIPFMRDLRALFDKSHEFGTPIVDLNIDWWGPSARDRPSLDNLLADAVGRYTSLAEFLGYIQ